MWADVLKWIALNIGPAIPFIFSGAFSVWALVLKMKSDAAKRADEAARETRDEARRKQEKADRESSELRIETERVKSVAFEKAERLLAEERERSARLLADKINDMNYRAQSMQAQLDLYKASQERDELTIERLRENLDHITSTLGIRDQELGAAQRLESELRRRVQELESEVKHLKGNSSP